MGLPFALATAAWTGLAAVLGALVGATAGGIVDTVLESQREQKLAKAGARLVAGDIAMASSQLQVAQSEGMWFSYFEFEHGDWEEYRGVLAVALNNEEFEAVSQAVRELREIFSKIVASPAWPEGEGAMRLMSPTRTAFNLQLDGAAKAYNALAALAEHERVAGRIHAEPQATSE